MPSENEWYKAAYYDPNNGWPGVGGYWLFGTGSNTPPTAVASGTTPGTTVWGGQDGPAAVDQSGGLSPYGTQGQTGNVYQWMETDFADPTNSSDGNRVFRGGYWQTTTVAQRSDFRLQISPSSFAGYTGFRVASVPEPASAALLGLGTLLLTTRRRSA